MKTKKYRKITHRKHYRKKNIIISKKVHKSTRRNNKKRYKGGSDDMLPYTFNSLEYMLGSLKNLIYDKDEQGNLVLVELYKGSILDVILEGIRTKGTIDENLFNGFPQLIKLILKLEVKPSNTLEFIYFIFEVKEEDKEAFKGLLGFQKDLIKFIDKNRNEKIEKEDYEIGWSLLSSFVITLIEAINMSVDFGLEEDKINKVYNKDSIIQCGLIDSYLYGSKHTQSDIDSTTDSIFSESYKPSIQVTNFYNSFRYPPIQFIKRPDTIRRDTVERAPRKTIYDFFDNKKNPTGILPPFVLFILLCRINPDINGDTEVMKKNRTTILNNIQYYLTICCKQCCVGYEDADANADPDAKCPNSKCVAGDPKLVSIAKKMTLEENICTNSECLDEFNWRTFDKIFQKATNNGKFVQNLIETPLFYNIAPLSTFLPINANTYIKEVFYKKMDDKKRKEFDAKIKFYEIEIYKAYKQSEDGLCSRNYNNSEFNDDLCKEYIEKGPLYIPYDLLLIIIEKYKNNKSNLEKIMRNARLKRNKIKEKAANIKEPTVFSRLLNRFKRKPAVVETVPEANPDSRIIEFNENLSEESDDDSYDNSEYIDVLPYSSSNRSSNRSSKSQEYFLAPENNV